MAKPPDKSDTPSDSMGSPQRCEKHGTQKVRVKQMWFGNPVWVHACLECLDEQEKNK